MREFLHFGWFDSSYGTALCAAIHLLKLKGYHISVACDGETPDIRWTLTDKQGHFEKTPTHYHPKSRKHCCFNILRLPRVQSCADETVNTRPRNSITTQSRPRFIGSAKTGFPVCPQRHLQIHLLKEYG